MNRFVTLTSAIVIAGSLLWGANATAQTETMLYSFNPANGTDGYNAYAGVVQDSSGNLYGTTQNGGAFNQGTVYKVAPDGSETVLYAFTGGADGGGPSLEQLTIDKASNLYGTTNNGGTSGLGTVFMVTPSGVETVLYSFGSQAGDGAHPYAGVARDKQGNLYGTTYDFGANGYGNVFKLTPSGTETVLHDFAGGSDGCHPFGSGVVLGKKNMLYGTTEGCGASGRGIVFQLTQSGTETVLYTFTGGMDGGVPSAGVTLDKAGNVYGTTFSGGQSNQGTVFELTPTGTETVLHSFACDGTDGCYPFASVIFDKLGNLYGTTYNGGSNGTGTVFEISSAGNETILHSFMSDATDGGNPAAPVIFGKKKTLYGTTNNGGAYGYGAVFKLKP